MGAARLFPSHVLRGSAASLLSFYLYFLAGFLGGIPGGMGMGGGTLLIPLLTLLLRVGQKQAQLCNLLSFLPMALFALFKHEKSGLVQKEGSLVLILPALAGSLAGSLCSLFLDGDLLKKGFGFFLIFLSVIQFTNGKKSDKIEA